MARGLVELQYVAPDSNGLFLGAISESGEATKEMLCNAVHRLCQMQPLLRMWHVAWHVHLTCSQAA